VNDPPTTAITPRPVWARHIRRQTGEKLEPPSEGEIRDAILVLRDAPILDWAPAGFLLHTEALRILDEAD
jgi:hypothetical protein